MFLYSIKLKNEIHLLTVCKKYFNKLLNNIFDCDNYSLISSFQQMLGKSRM